MYESSTNVNDYVDLTNGERRQRVGDLFKIAPGPVMKKLVTRDDNWKLRKYTLEKQGQRIEKNVARVQ